MLGHLVDAHRRARRGKAPRDQQIQDGAIIFRHDPRRAHHAARIAVHDLVGLVEMRPRPLDQRRAHLRQRRLGDHLVRIVAGDAGVQQRLRAADTAGRAPASSSMSRRMLVSCSARPR